MLLEVLVACLIFSFGVLGVVALQAKMVQAQTVGKFRADAVYLADELVGLMWSDTAHLSSYATTGCASYSRCNDWATKVTSQLPGGTPTVTVNGATGEVDIAISWSTRNGNQHYQTSTAVVP